MTERLDGRRLARRLSGPLRERISALPRAPGLAVVCVGDDPASHVYVGKKAARAAALGLHHQGLFLPADTSQAALHAQIDALCADPAIDGVLLQLPLPPPLDAVAAILHIDPARDVDGLHPMNVGRLSRGEGALVPCTPKGVMHLLTDFLSASNLSSASVSSGKSLSGARAVVVGRSNIVGRPMAMLLEQANATVTICHSRTRDLAEHTRVADVLVVAVGRPEMITGEMVKPGAVVIDVGIHRRADGTLCGDVHQPSVTGVARALTPVPGGVGPMTVAMLMHNTVGAAERRLGVG